MLQLPVDDADFEELMRLVRWGADGISDCLRDIGSEAAAQWRHFEGQAKAALARHELPAGNWWRGGLEGGIQYDTWHRFAQLLPALCEDLDGHYPVAGDLDLAPVRNHERETT
jgi:hypothetical protein